MPSGWPATATATSCLTRLASQISSARFDSRKKKRARSGAWGWGSLNIDLLSNRCINIPLRSISTSVVRCCVCIKSHNIHSTARVINAAIPRNVPQNQQTKCSIDRTSLSLKRTEQIVISLKWGACACSRLCYAQLSCNQPWRT